MQETTATVLSAALASKKPEPPTSGTSVIGTSEQGGSSGTAVPSPTSQKNVQSSEATSSVRSEMAKVHFSFNNYLLNCLGIFKLYVDKVVQF